MMIGSDQPLFAAPVARDGEFRLAATLYYVAVQKDYTVGHEVPFRDVYGNVIRRGSEEFHAAASIEGTAEFNDGQVLNYSTRINDEVRWMPVSFRYGIDARGCALVPLRSVAVDPTVVPLGTLLLISETIDMPLPGGGRHDGIWIAADTGDGITGRRIDLFAGRGISSMQRIERFGIEHLQELTVRPVGSADSC